MNEDYSVEIIDIVSNFCKRKKLRKQYLNYRFNNRPHYNQKWKCKVLSSLQIFLLEQKFCSFNYLDLQLGKEYIEKKFTESLYYAICGRELPTGHWLKPIKNIILFGKIEFKIICKFVLRHRDIIRDYEIKIQKQNEIKKITYKSNMENFI